MARKLQVAIEQLTKHNDQYLYHYSKTLYKDLRSLRAQNNLSVKELNKIDNQYTKSYHPKPYTEHISFFIEPIPYDIIGDLFKNQHYVWVNGNELYEYKIPISSLESNIIYMLVETKKDTKQFDEEYNPTMTSKEFDNFSIKKQKTKITNGDIGSGRNHLIKTINAYLGTTRNYFIVARKRKDAEETSKQYSAMVSHLMLYPSTGIIKYENYRKVIIGKIR